MAFYDTTWYTNAGDQSTTGHYAVAKRPQNAAVAAGVLRRQFTAPAVGSERVFVCIVAGTTANVADATWVLTRGAKTTDGTATWQECTGASAANGDLTNTVNWTQAKAIGVPTLGAIIQRNNGASYQICSTAGTLGASEPGFSDTAGVTTTEGTTTWTSLGVVGNFTAGGAPHARLANACAATWSAGGHTIYVGDNHAESQTTAISITATGAANFVNKIICHNHSGSYPPATGDITTGATVTTTAAAGITVVGASGPAFCYIRGIAFAAGSGTASAANITVGASTGGVYFDACSLQLANTSASSIMTLGGAGSFSILSFNNTTFKFAASGQNITLGPAVVVWSNTAPGLASGSSVPAVLFNLNSTSTIPNLTVEAVDLSALTGAVLSYNQAMGGNFTFKDCKLNASAGVGTPSGPGSVVQLIRCDSGATAYKSARYAYEGTETTETSITRVGGASDPTGQAQSRKVVTTANTQWLRPFRCEPYAIWNPTTGSNVTVTICGTINSGTLPNNDTIWLDVEYLGSSATPQGTIVTTTKANLLASNAAVASDSSTWNGGGSGAGWSPFKLTITLSSPQPGLAGYLHARVRVGSASTTYYIDPKVTLT